MLQWGKGEKFIAVQHWWNSREVFQAFYPSFLSPSEAHNFPTQNSDTSPKICRFISTCSPKLSSERIWRCKGLFFILKLQTKRTTEKWKWEILPHEQFLNKRQLCCRKRKNAFTFQSLNFAVLVLILGLILKTPNIFYWKSWLGKWR